MSKIIAALFAASIATVAFGEEKTTSSKPECPAKFASVCEAMKVEREGLRRAAALHFR